MPQVARDIRRFQEYVVAYVQSHPRRESGSRKRLKIPWPWQMHAILLHTTNLDEQAIWNKPVNECFCLAGAVSHYLGDDRFKDEGEIRFDEEAEREWLAAQKEGKT
jgi:hypothetical protein